MSSLIPDPSDHGVPGRLHGLLKPQLKRGRALSEGYRVLIIFHLISLYLNLS